MANPALRSLRTRDIYQNIYPWSNKNEFLDFIKSTIAYKSNDNSLIALSKPFGVGTYQVQDTNTKKQNQDRVLYKLYGRPRYCINDILEPLTEEYGVKDTYRVIKSLDRYSSGLILLSSKFDDHRERWLKACSASRIARSPPFGFRAITCGYPIMKSNKISERVGVELLEVDELGDYKEPVIVSSPSRNFRTNQEKSVVQVDLEVKNINRELPSALVELYVSKTSYDFPRCYLSSKTAFILGDVRFSKRVREVMGRKIQVSAFKSSSRYEDGYEPLGPEMRSVLGVRGNSWLPLMLDLHSLRLKNFWPKMKGESRDLNITSPNMPLHFVVTAEALRLID